MEEHSVLVEVAGCKLKLWKSDCKLVVVAAAAYNVDVVVAVVAVAAAAVVVVGNVDLGIVAHNGIAAYIVVQNTAGNIVPDTVVVGQLVVAADKVDPVVDIVVVVVVVAVAVVVAAAVVVAFSYVEYILLLVVPLYLYRNCRPQPRSKWSGLKYKSIK